MSRFREIYDSLDVIPFFDYQKCKTRLDELKENLEKNNEDVGDIALKDVFSLIKISNQLLEWNYRLEQRSSLANVDDLKGMH